MPHSMLNFHWASANHWSLEAILRRTLHGTLRTPSFNVTFSDADMKNISLDSEILRFHYRVPTFFSQNDVCELKTSARTCPFENNMFASDSEILRFHYRGTYC